MLKGSDGASSAWWPGERRCQCCLGRWEEGGKSRLGAVEAAVCVGKWHRGNRRLANWTRGGDFGSSLEPWGRPPVPECFWTPTTGQEQWHFPFPAVTAGKVLTVCLEDCQALCMQPVINPHVSFTKEALLRPLFYRQDTETKGWNGSSTMMHPWGCAESLAVLSVDQGLSGEPWEVLHLGQLPWRALARPPFWRHCWSAGIVSASDFYQ